MKKKYMQRMSILMMLAVISVGGCSGQRLTEKNDSEMTVLEKEDVVIDRKDHVYHIGEEIANESIDHETHTKYVEDYYTIQSATLYDSANEIDGVSEKLYDVEFYAGGDSQKPGLLRQSDLSESSFLYCDISIKNVKDTLCNISNLGLAYEQNGVCSFLCYPAYFSAAKDGEHGGFEYNILPGQTINAQIGWCADPRLLQIENFDVKNLYLVVDYAGEEEMRKFIELGLD